MAPRYQTIDRRIKIDRLDQLENIRRKEKSVRRSAMVDIARGLEGIVVAGTRLSHIDGQRGELVIAGYPVDEIAPNATYEEVLHLLWRGALPEPAQLATLTETLAANRQLPAATVALLHSAAERRLAVMDALRIAVGTLSLTV